MSTAMVEQPEGPELIKMSELARRSGVPAPTIKHYMREGLLPPPAKRTSRNMAYYDAGLVPRIAQIKELQRTQFLPLKVIKDLLAQPAATSDENDTMLKAIADVLEGASSPGVVSRQEVLAAGVTASDLEYMTDIGMISAEGEGDDATYSGDDLEIIRTVKRARDVGLTPDMLPTEILGAYFEALQFIVRMELKMFRDGVLPRADGDLGDLATEATRLSELLVIHIRRKQLIPTLKQLVADEVASRK